MRKQTAQGSSGIKALAANPTARIVNATRPIASDRMGRNQRWKSRHEARHASEYSRGGRNTERTTWGAISTGASPGRRAHAIPARAIKTGGGNPTRGATIDAKPINPRTATRPGRSSLMRGRT